MNTREMLVESRVRCAVRLHLVANTKKRHSITLYKHGDVHGAPWLRLLVCGVSGVRRGCYFRHLSSYLAGVPRLRMYIARSLWC
jgi:hypothetical protein